jgi:hypothetical protein
MKVTAYQVIGAGISLRFDGKNQMFDGKIDKLVACFSPFIENQVAKVTHANELLNFNVLLLREDLRRLFVNDL